MFESLKSWCVFPVYVHRYSGFSASGDALHATTVEYKCYHVDSMLAITDKNGKEYISNTQVYLPSGNDVSIEDFISFPDLSTPREIRKLGDFLDGNTRSISIRVIYL